MRHATFLIFALFATFAIGNVQAQTYPAKPVRLIAPFPAGGGTDILARMIARKLGEDLSQSFIVDNRTGAAGIIGTEAVARAAPDGYTLLMGTTGTQTTNPAVFAKLPYDPVKDFAPVSLVGNAPFVLVVHPSIPVNSLRELIALAKAKPDTLTYSSSGIGGIAHLGFVALNTAAGTRMIHVPYKGSPLQTQAAVAGEVALAFDSIPVTQPFIKSGRVRALGIGSPKRSALLPDVPSVAEAGLPGYELASWYAIFAPAATPPDLIRTLNRAISKGLEGNAMRDQFATLGAEPVGGSPEELAATVQKDLRKWAKVARDGGVKPE